MSSLTDFEVQTSFRAAEQYLAGALSGKDVEDYPKMSLALALIQNVRIFSKSSNGIPALRGMGLREAVRLAETILAEEPRTDRDLSLHKYTHLDAGSIIVAPRK